MKWFVFLFFSCFALIHFYGYYRLIKPFNKEKRIRNFALILLLISYFSPLFWRYADSHWDPSIAKIFAFTGLVWMGFLFYLFCCGLLFDFYHFLVFSLKRIFGINPLPTIKNPIFSVIVFLLALPLSLYSYYETLNLRVERIRVKTHKLPPHVQSLKILHFSDLHLGPLMGMDKIQLIKRVYEKEKPDLIVSTGDLVDGNMQDKFYLAESLAQINPPLGKFAVLGNHEYYRGIHQAVEFTNKAGFKLLRGESVSLNEINLTLAGMEDETCKYFKTCLGTLSDFELLKKVEKSYFILYLKHQPKLEKKAYNLFDLMLSGHTHGGLYYPLGGYILSLIYIADRGLHKIGNSYIYISKGVGTGGPPMRFLSPPDVAIIELVPK